VAPQKHYEKSLIPITIALALPASAAVIQFDLEGQGGSGLLGANEVSPVTGGGSGGEILGGITYETTTMTLSINVGWGSNRGFTDMTGTVNAAHLHGPASQSANAGVLVGLTIDDNSATNGFITQDVVLSPVQEGHLLNGLIYFNGHTAVNGGGEIRGNLVQVPEPGAMLLTLLGGVGFLRRRRS